ncbi:MAG TPA: hypothetical protein EYG80_07135 [Flavobacteriaceae bacterium]|nr:hypothetical protein [Flavobacteriaceae bacterium]
MSKIETIKKSKTISYENESIEYFIEENSDSWLVDYTDIIHKIKNAKSIIKIAATSYVDEKIIDAIYDIDEDSTLNSYLILKDFNKSNKTVQRFDERKPTVIREVKELENNFILIDNKAYLFLNPLSEKNNIFLEFNEAKSSDLEFIFNYYFWNKSSKEKLINEESTTVNSPFPPFSLREQHHVNVEELDDEYERVYIPRDKKYSSKLDMKASKKYFSDDIEVPIYLNDDSFYIGNFKVYQTMTITNSWILKENTLGNIDSTLEIIPKDKKWSKSIKVIKYKETHLPDITSDSIETMEDQEPAKYPKEEFIKRITFLWNILAPKKPNNAKKSILYIQHEEFRKREERSKNEKLEAQNLLKKKNEEKSKVDKELTQLNQKDKTYKSKKNTLKVIDNSIKKLEEKISKKDNFSKPKYPLPTIGVLYENNDTYFLEISTYEDLDKAKKSEKDYIDKNNFSIVVSN